MMRVHQIAICHALRERIEGELAIGAMSLGRWAGYPITIFDRAKLPPDVAESVSEYADVTKIAIGAVGEWGRKASRLVEETRRIDRAAAEVVRSAITVVRRPNPDHAAHDARLQAAVDEYEEAIEARRACCDHANAQAVSGPTLGVTEYYCEDCEEYFDRSDDETETARER